MKFKKIIPILMTLPLLASCGELEIPTVDVEAITPVLPEKPVYNTGAIATDGVYDYLDFYELSDMHGAVNPGTTELGLGRLASYLDIKRSSNPGGTVVVSSGDMFQGSAESNLTRGYMVSYAMNYMGFDSMAIGNHEFDWTDAWIKKNANIVYNDYKVPFISANIVKKGTTETPDFISKSVIVNRGDYKIGIVGSIGEQLKSSILKSCVDGYDFLNEIEAVNSEAQKLKEVDKCDVVLLTSHNDVELLNSRGLKNIDAIFGGHAHIAKSVYIDEGVPAAQTKNYGQTIAHIQLKIDKVTKGVSCSVNESDDTPTYLEGLKVDENVTKIMNNYSPEIDKIKNIELGSTSEFLKRDGALKGICVEGMYQGALKGIDELDLDIDEDDILATFHNVNGGIRDDIEEGTITYGSVYSPFPFDNEIVLYKVKGSLFKQKAAKYPSFAVRREFEAKDEIDNNKEYYLVLTDFIALSKSYFGGIFPIEEKDLIRTGKVVRDEVAAFIYKEGKIDAEKFLSNKAPYKSIPQIF